MLLRVRRKEKAFNDSKGTCVNVPFQDLLFHFRFGKIFASSIIFVESPEGLPQRVVAGYTDSAPDLAEVIGSAIALNLLFGLPIWAGGQGRLKIDFPQP